MISVSILSAKDKDEAIVKLNKTDSDYLHLDVMDGNFVSNRCFTLEEIRGIQKKTLKMIDMHLMVDNPLYYINNLSSEKIELITFHVELDRDLEDIIKAIKSRGIKVGMAINPNTSLDLIDPYLDKIDMVLVMSVVPGLGGQKFIEASIDRVKTLRNVINQRDLKVMISIDGGINEVNANYLSDADMLVSGSFVTNSDDYQEQIRKLRKKD